MSTQGYPYNAHDVRADAHGLVLAQHDRELREHRWHRRALERHDREIRDLGDRLRNLETKLALDQARIELERGRSWTVVYDENPEGDKNRQQRSKGGFPTQREAERFLVESLSRLGDGSYTQPSKATLGEYLTGEWLPAIASTVRPRSFAAYESTVRLRIVPELGSVRLQALSPGHLNGLYRSLEVAGLSANTRRLTHTVVRSALAEAVRWGKLVRNPATLAVRPKPPQSSARSWTATELRRFLEHVKGDRLFALWRLAATSGMRRAELAGLTWRTLDLDGALLSVEQQLTPGGGFGPPKSARSRRTIALDPETVNALRAHREVQVLERDLAGDAYDDHDLVFADELGRPIRLNRLTALFGDHRKAAGVTGGTLHTLRHTAITIALTSGVPVHIVAARAGDKAETVLSTYAHLLPSSDEIAAERIAAALVA
jgi:integrase